jgi:glycerol 3-phosphatase-1
MRTIDVLKKWCHITDGPTLEKEVIRFETAILEAAEALGRETGESGIQVLPGVAKLLDDLSADKEKRGGEEKWAICTSCTFCSLQILHVAD